MKVLLKTKFLLPITATSIKAIINANVFANSLYTICLSVILFGCSKEETASTSPVVIKPKVDTTYTDLIAFNVKSAIFQGTQTKVPIEPGSLNIIGISEKSALVAINPIWKESNDILLPESTINVNDVTLSNAVQETTSNGYIFSKASGTGTIQFITGTQFEKIDRVYEGSTLKSVKIAISSKITLIFENTELRTSSPFPSTGTLIGDSKKTMSTFLGNLVMEGGSFERSGIKLKLR